MPASKLVRRKNQPADGVSATPPRITGEKQKGGERMKHTGELFRELQEQFDKMANLRDQLGHWGWNCTEGNTGEFDIRLLSLHYVRFPHDRRPDSTCPVCCTIGEGGRAYEFINLTSALRRWLGAKCLVFHYRYSKELSEVDLRTVNPNSVIGCEVLPICDGVRWIKD